MSTSYAYDPNGNKVNVVIKDGKSYLEDGSRVGVGYTVQTGGGIYKMTDQGGVKVDSHNTAPNSSSTSTRRTSNNDDDDSSSSGTFNQETINKNRRRIYCIAGY